MTRRLPFLVVAIATAYGLVACPGPTKDTPPDTGTPPVDPPDVLPPVVVLDAPLEGDVLAGSVTLTATASDDVGVTRVSFTVDGEQVGDATSEPWSISWDSTASINGNVVVQAIAEDAAGNSAADAARVEIENSTGLATDAVRILHPADGATLCGTVTVEALVAADGPIVVFELDGTNVATDATSPYTWDWGTTSSSNTIHALRATATASDGRQGQHSITVTVSNTGEPCDNLPSVVFLAPEDGTWTWGAVPVSVTATDDAGVTGVEFFVDDGLFASDTSPPYETTWASVDFEEGPHSLKAIATDTKGQEGEAQVTVNLDRTPPTVLIESPATNETVSGIIEIQASAEDNFEVASVLLDLDGVAIGTADTAPFTLELDTTALAWGVHLLDASAVDRAGHEGYDTVRFQVDNPPSVGFTSPTTGATVSGVTEVAISAEDDDEVVSVAFSLDGAAATVDSTSPWSWAWDTCLVSTGPHTLTAVATDSGGQEAVASLVVTTDQPLTVEISSPTGVLNPSEVLLVYSDDDEPVEEVVLTLDGTTIATLTSSTPASSAACSLACGCTAWTGAWSAAGLAEGTYTLTATATNASGTRASDTVTVEVDLDADTDGFEAVSWGGTDCDDADPTVYPGAPERCDGTDEDCDGVVDEDYDQDGDGAWQEGLCPWGDDCDDLDPEVHPGGLEVCDGADNDCDGDVDMSDEVGTLSLSQGSQTGITTYEDMFQGTAFLATEDQTLQSFAMVLDQYSGSTVRLMVFEATTRWDWTFVTAVTVSGCCSMDWYESGALDLPLTAGHYYAIGVGVSGETYTSIDSSGDMTEEAGLTFLGSVHDSTTPFPTAFSEDPYDYSSQVFRVDVDTIADVDIDSDADGYTAFCGDCDEASAGTNPGAPEVCSTGEDEDCDGFVDEAFDADADGVSTCTDCDDGDPTVYPDAPETCDHTDDDCDGTPDDSPVDGVVQHADADGDGYGDPSATSSECAWTAGWTLDASDCDDTTASRWPGAPEACDGLDNDCDGTTDEGSDADGDGWGACVDCDDTNPAISPDAVDTCDGVDDDCDGWTDTSGLWIEDAGSWGNSGCYNYTYDSWVGNVYQPKTTLYLESFTATVRVYSGYDDFEAMVLEATSSSGPYVPIWSKRITVDASASSVATPDLDLLLTRGNYYLVGVGVSYGYLYALLDCSSSASTDANLTSPGAIEDYGTGLPTSISASPDAGDHYSQQLRVRYPDTADLDQDGDGLTTWCGDCDDGDSARHPGGVEICDAEDDDCDGLVDEDFDADGDGYLDITACRTLGTDCDDTVSSTYPGAPEPCDGVDNDCDDAVDVSEPLVVGTASFGDLYSVSSVTNDFYGNIYLADDDGVLSSFEVWADPTAGATGTWIVLESLSRTGTYTAIATGSASLSGTVDWYASPTLDVPLVAGRYYLVGMGSPSAAVFYYDPTPDLSPTSNLTPQGYTYDASSATPTSVSNDPTSSRLYAQRLTVDFVTAVDRDDDGDGATPYCGDCDDGDAAFGPDAPEVCDGRDQDCDGLADEGFDADADGFASCVDCDDGDPGVYPDAAETCDGVDQDCDGAVDEDALDGDDAWADSDGDGFGDDTLHAVSCAPISGWVAVGGDCDDDDPSAYPDAAEDCDGADDDCDGLVDEGWDTDGDGAAACVDCDDSDPARHPSATETCDGVDNDCDGFTDTLTGDTWETASFGDTTSTASASTDLYGNVFWADDDTTLRSFDVYANPDGSVNVYFRVYEAPTAAGPFVLLDAVSKTISGAEDWYASGTLDVDLEAGHAYLLALGTAGTTALFWSGSPDLAPSAGLTPAGYASDTTSANPATVTTGATATRLYAMRVTAGGLHPTDRDEDLDGTTEYCGDCDDADATAFPGAPESCDGADDDCDGTVDDGFDDDGDGALDADRCGSFGTDCDDADPLVHPGTYERCDAIDNDCDGTIDEPDAVDAALWYLDRDSDGDGDAARTTLACDLPTGYAATDTDCDDEDPGAFLGAPETCNGVDDDCDEYVDEGFLDADGDGSAACVDCDDTDTEVRPWADETCDDGIDQDCDGRDRLCAYGGTFDLGTTGLKWYGTGSNDYVGISVAGDFDADADGHPDILVGGYGWDGTDTSAGAAWLLRGPVSTSDSLSAAIRLEGESHNDYAGIAVASPGDVDDDGFDDLLVGAHGVTGTSAGCGAAYLVYGPVTASLDLALADVDLTGEATNDYAGYALAGAGDLDGDGRPDLAVGAYGNDGGGTDAGRVYVVSGAAALSGALASTASAVLTGESGAEAGRAVASAGDVNGDGWDDLVVGAWQYSTSTYGAVYLLLGPVTADRSLATADARLRGESASDDLGAAVAHLDANGDGYDDLLAGAPGDDDGGTDAGAVYLVNGPVTGTPTISSAMLGKITGGSSYSSLGYALTSGDVDDDGMEDVFAGDWTARPDGTDSGAACLFYGPVTGKVGTTAADATFNGEDTSDQAGRAVAWGGDLDGDGMGDLLLGAPGENTTVAAGAVYLLRFSDMP